ncbi:MAG: RNA pseudouridine synthase [Bacteroidetes bacterium]|nr:RNA pseudouridine synthase [Bacteroidota bacterium]
MKLERIYEDDHLVIVNKPANLLSIADRFDSNQASVRSLIQAELKLPIFVVHRLDKETSGLIAFAKHESSHRYLSQLFERHEIEKLYAGLVLGRVNTEAARIELPIAEHPFVKGKMIVSKQGKLSVTDYRVVESWPLYSLMQWQIHTGRTHQIRVHMAASGHPIVCDTLYGDGKAFLLSSVKPKFKLSKTEEQERPLLNRLALHAYRLQFEGPDGKLILAEAPIPKDLSACIAQLRKLSR